MPSLPRARVLVVMIALAAGGPAWGAPQPATPPPAGALGALLECRSLADDAARLACFDARAATLASAQAGGSVVVVDRAQVDEVRRQAFGFSLPSLAFLVPSGREGTAEAEPIRQVESSVTTARMSRDGKWILSLANGSTWRQTDTERVVRDPRPGSKVVIRTAALGSYLVSVDGQRSFRARREE